MWLWRDSLRARELAARVSQHACNAESVQFLDDTVSLAGLKPVFDHGKLVLQRVYQFEFSRRGVDRQVGSIMLTGERLDTIFLTPDELAPPPESAERSTVVPFKPPRKPH